MNILDKIVKKKKKEIFLNININPLKKLVSSKYFERPIYSTKSFLLNPNKTGIIAEYKRKSPSKGIINDISKVQDITKGYENFGASAISVLTDNQYFGGCNDDILNIRNEINIPILRKDFIVDEYQVYETKSIGADLILLIAECLTQEEVNNLSQLAKNIGLEVLLEMHSENEIEKINENIDIIGINNRDLKTFKVDLKKSIELFNKIPSKYLRITESGISSISDFQTMKNAGFQGFLIGENFMKETNPVDSFKHFIKKI